MHRLRGTLLLSLHKHAAAEDGYRDALAVARRQSAKFWELGAALDLARLWRDQGKPQQARELLAQVYGWFTEGFLDLKEAEHAANDDPAKPLHDALKELFEISGLWVRNVGNRHDAKRHILVN
jgi:predicted ATPase